MNESLLQKCTRHYKMQDYTVSEMQMPAILTFLTLDPSHPFPTQHSWPRRVQATQVPDMGNDRHTAAYLKLNTAY